MHHLLMPLALALALALCACPPVAQGDDDDGKAPPDLVSLGGITLRQAPASYQVSAFFHEPTLAALCTTEKVAGCTFFHCAGEATPPAEATLDAGAITVASADVNATLTIGTDGFYDLVSSDERAFFANAEELIATSAGGVDVGAFELNLIAPTRIQLTAPPLQSVNVRVTNPIDVAWSNTSAGDVKATLEDTPFTRFATCTVPASASALSIPADVVGRFPIGGGRLYVEVASTTSEGVDATHSAFLLTISSVTSPTGTLGEYNVFFEAP